MDWRNVTWWHVKIFTSHTSKSQIKKEDMTVIFLRIFFKGVEYRIGWWESYTRYFRNNSTVNDPSTWRLDGSFVSGLWEILRNCYGGPTTIDGTGKQMLPMQVWTSDTFRQNKGVQCLGKFGEFVILFHIVLYWSVEIQSDAQFEIWWICLSSISSPFIVSYQNNLE